MGDDREQIKQDITTLAQYARELGLAIIEMQKQLESVKETLGRLDHRLWVMSCNEEEEEEC